ncbi:MAG: DUF3263 domain-containing protein [Rhodococcus sp. (in: high G+C Gram-positive bacteria)]
MPETAPTSVDSAMLSFGQSWHKYGGGSEEDIYVAFGLSARSYFERLTALLDGPAGASLDESIREKMRAVCARRMH